MAHDPESGEHDGEIDPEVFEGLVERAMITAQHLTIFPPAVIAEALRRAGVVDNQPESPIAAIPEQDATPAVPRPRLEVD